MNTPTLRNTSNREAPAIVHRFVCVGNCCNPTEDLTKHVIHEDEQRIVFGKNETRSDSNEQYVYAGEFADEEHAIAQLEEYGIVGRLVIQDTSTSPNNRGMWINGARCSAHTLSDGDVVQLGGTMFVYRFGAMKLADLGLLKQPKMEGDLGSVSLEYLKETRKIRHLAPTDFPVLITGETGTGKEVAAVGLHERSGRTGKYVPINAGSLPKELVQTELEGCEEGAYSGAVYRQGLFRAAVGGTALLDEIGLMPLQQQQSLLRILQEKRVKPVGTTQTIPIDARIVFATDRDLNKLVEEGNFQKALLGRVKRSGCVIELPRLVDRIEDVGLLVGRFIKNNSSDPKKVHFSPSAYRMLLEHQYPLNVRELEQIIQGVLLYCGDGFINSEIVEEVILENQAEKEWTQEQPKDPTPKRTDLKAKKRDEARKAQKKKRELERMLLLHKGNISATAEGMGRSRNGVSADIKRHGINLDKIRKTQKMAS